MENKNRCYIEENPDCNPRLIWPGVKDRIDYAFTLDVDGVETRYYWFSDVMSMSVERSYAAMVYWHEMSSSCTREYIKSHTEAMDKILNDPKGPKFTEVAKLNEYLKERLEWAILPESAYKMVGVVFFDETEEPTRVDYKHLAKKAKDFQSCPIESFFFLQPISKYVPIGPTQELDLRTFLTAVTERDHEAIQEMSEIIRSKVSS